MKALEGWAWGDGYLNSLVDLANTHGDRLFRQEILFIETVRCVYSFAKIALWIMSHATRESREVTNDAALSGTTNITYPMHTPG